MKLTRPTRLLALLLALLLTLALFGACSEGTQGGDESTSEEEPSTDRGDESTSAAGTTAERGDESTAESEPTTEGGESTSEGESTTEGGESTSEGESTAENGETTVKEESTTEGSTTEGSTTEEDVTTSAPRDPNALKVSDYTLLFPAFPHSATSDATARLMAAVAEKTGAQFGAVGSDVKTPVGEFEILVGPTDRPESVVALADLNGAIGYVVKRFGNKIVINANLPALVDEAAQYFIMNFVEAGANGAFSVPKDLAYTYVAGNALVFFDKNGAVLSDLVYSAALDVKVGTDSKDKVDYVVEFFLDLKADLGGRFGDGVSLRDDGSSANPAKLEILLGRTNRPETATFLASLGVSEYGYGIVGNKLVIAGWSELTIGKAVDLFLADLPKYVVESNGARRLVMTESDTVVRSHTPWNVSIPLYEGGRLDGAVQLLYDNYEAYYVGTDAAEFMAYCETLEAAGFRLHQENQIGANLYATYCNQDTVVHTYYTAYAGAVRVIVEDLAGTVLPQNEDRGWEKVTETTFTMLALDDAAGNFGNCFIITLEDGSFILHDGGGDKGTVKNADRDELWKMLNHLNKRKDGKIVIAAWIISHEHWDHFKNAYDMFSAYRSQNLRLERIIYNVPSATARYNSNNPGNYFETGKINEVARWFAAEQLNMHSGQTIRIRNLKLEILYTTEDLYPDAIVKFNNSSLVHRFTVGSGSDTQTVTIVGDIEEVASKRLVQMYGRELQTDIVQVAHHGYGGSIELYALFKPTVVLWPKDQKAVNGQLSGSGYYPKINQSLVNQSNVLMVVVADNGHRTVSLPIVGLTSNRNQNLKHLVEVTPRFDGLP